MLTAHVGRFRHVDACEGFRNAKPESFTCGQGESYDADLYEQIIPAVLAHVANGADLLPEVMAELGRTEEGPDAATIARIDRGRETAMKHLASDRDAFAFNETMSRLDAEEAAARATTRDLPTIEQARGYLSDLPRLYEASGPEERKLLAQALFERIDMLGVEEVTLKVTQQAKDNGWLEAWAGQTLNVPLERCTYGRGERI